MSVHSLERDIFLPMALPVLSYAANRVTLVLLVALLADAAEEPARFADLHASLLRDADDGDARVRALVTRAGGTPVVEGSTAVFLVEGDPRTPPRVVGDWNGWGEGDPEGSRLERLGTTRFFFRRVELPRTARVEYLVAMGEQEILDPLNPRRVEGYSGPQSEVRMPDYLPVVDEKDDPATPPGELVSFEHRSTVLSNTRRVYVYLPAGYDASRSRRYPEAWLGDGRSYVEAVGVPRLLDRLIAQGRLEPVVAIFVDTPDRRVEYSLHAGYRRMMVEELVPLIAKDYRVENVPARRLLAGGSRGGQMAIDLCLAAPDVFGLCGAWAPAISPREMDDFLGARRTSGRFVLLRALYDDRFGADAPALRDGLRALGARVEYLEAPQGHTLGAWPDLTAQVVLTLFPGSGR